MQLVYFKAPADWDLYYLSNLMCNLGKQKKEKISVCYTPILRSVTTEEMMKIIVGGIPQQMENTDQQTEYSIKFDYICI